MRKAIQQRINAIKNGAVLPCDVRYNNKSQQYLVTDSVLGGEIPFDHYGIALMASKSYNQLRKAVK